MLRATGEDCVVKLQPKARLRTKDEAQLRGALERLLGLRHGNVVALLGCYEDDAGFYTVPRRGNTGAL